MARIIIYVLGFTGIFATIPYGSSNAGSHNHIGKKVDVEHLINSGPNLTYSSSYLNEDCSQLFLTICNTGDLPYTSNKLRLVLYDGNPISTNGISFVEVDFNLNRTLLSGNCMDLNIWAADFSFFSGDIYAFFNIGPGISTPFDFENDFPNTPYSEHDYEDNLFIFNFENCETVCPNDDLIVTQVNLTQDCTKLKLRVCNTGQSPFQEDLISISLYDENPLTRPAKFLHLLSFHFPTAIPLNRCSEIELDVSPYNSETGEIYAMINDDGSSSTPFDIEKDFPTTAFPECSYQNNLFHFNFEECLSSNGPNLTLDSYSLLNDCSQLSITFCNTGSVAYSDATFHLSFYDANPISEMVGLAVPYMINLSDDILPDECFEAKIFGVEILFAQDLLFGFINDNHSTTTPFDFQNDFPTSDFAENNYLDNQFFVDFADCNFVKDEICDNLIDDDGDGLIDAFDPDCECDNIPTSVIDHVQNPGFEEHTGCCTEIQKGASCVNGWEPVGGTADYYGLDCIIGASQIASVEQVHVTKFDNSFISIGTAENFSEAMGSCLVSPLLTGESYSVELRASFPSSLLVTLSSPIEFTLYGISAPCPDFSTLTVSSNDNLCLTTLLDQAQELITISSDDILNFEFKTFTSTFTPTSDVDYIMLSIKCDIENKGGTFFQVGYVQISELAGGPWEFDEIITVSDPCENTITLSVPFSDTLSYQWYQDSIPMTGEQSSTVAITAANSQLFDYHVFVSNENGCSLLGPASIDMHNCIDSNLSFDRATLRKNCIELMVTICNNGDVPYNENVMYMSFYNDNPLESESDIIQSFSLSLNESIEPGDCHDIVLTLSQKLILEGSLFGVFNIDQGTATPFDLVNDFPTTDFAEDNYEDNLFALEFTDCDDPPLTEICNNGTDDDEDGLIDAFDPDCDCTPGVNNTWEYNEIISITDPCDNPITLNVPFSDTISYQWYIDSIPVNGQTFSTLNVDTNVYKQENKFFVNVYNGNGCRLIGPVYYSTGKTYRTPITVGVCTGIPYYFGDRTLTKSGFYLDTMISQEGCDSIIELTLEVSNYIIGNDSKTICSGEPYFFGGNYITKEGIYEDTIFSATQCDFIIRLDLKVLPNSQFSFQDSICPGEFREFKGQEIYEAGSYFDTLENKMGCDSILEFTLIEKILPEIFLEKYICEGTDFKVSSQTFTESGEYLLNLEADMGCDTLLHLTLNVMEMIIGDTTFAQILTGDSYDFNGKKFEREGIYEMVLPSFFGCDSTVYLHLNIEKNVYAPNVFSTSSTIGNNRFIIFSDEDVLIKKYNIYDRWGNSVFTNENFRISDGLENFWDGSCNGNRTVKGVYIYQIEYEHVDNQAKQLSGSVTVL